MSAYLAYHTSQARIDELHRQAEHHRLTRRDAEPAARGVKQRSLRHVLKLERAPRFVSVGR